MTCRGKDVPTSVVAYTNAFRDMREGLMISGDPFGRKVIARGQVQQKKLERQGTSASGVEFLSRRPSGNTESF